MFILSERGTLLICGNALWSGTAALNKGDRLTFEKNLSPDPILFFQHPMPYGWVTALASRVTAVCARALPLIFTPVFIEISV